jgi:hypothetical protein
MMMTEMDIETSVYYVHLMRLIAREDFIKSSMYVSQALNQTKARNNGGTVEKQKRGALLKTDS